MMQLLLVLMPSLLMMKRRWAPTKMAFLDESVTRSSQPLPAELLPNHLLCQPIFADFVPFHRCSHPSCS